MKNNNFDAQFARSWRRKIIVIWCGSACVLLGLLWSAIALEIAGDRAALHASTLQNVGYRADRYAGHVSRALDQLDHLSLLLASAKHSAGGSEVLQKQMQLVAEQGPIVPVYVDESGVVRSAHHQFRLGSNVSEEAFFTTHRDSRSPDLVIHRQDFGAGLAGQLAVRFTRRVDRPDGSFDGLLALFVPLSFFQSLKAPDAFSKGDFASIWFERDLPLMVQGEASDSAMSLGYLQRPRFTQRGGASLEPGSFFADKRAHYVGWKMLDQYPMQVIMAVRHDNAMALTKEAEVSSLLTGLLCMILILGCCTFGARMQITLNARRRREHELRNTFRLAVDSAREAFYMLVPTVGASGKSGLCCIQECNQHAAKIAGLMSSEMIGKTFAEIFPRLDPEKLNTLLQKAMQDGFFEAEITAHAETGEGSRWQHFSAVRSHAGVAVTVRDISDLKGKEQQLKVMAMTDALTLLPNRHWLKQQLTIALGAAKASDSKLALLFIDLDDFKKINDSQGHQAGDAYLVAVAATLQAAVRKEDHVVRLGGDEFTVLMEHVNGHDVAAKIAGQILWKLQALNSSAALHGRKPGASVGVAIFPDDAGDAAGLMEAADRAMYAAKAAGKGQFAGYSAAIADQFQIRQQLELDLQLALMRSELLLHFQPRACARTGKPLCLEALLRWQHPVRGLIAPGEFIALAEESNLIVQIGDWVVEETCAQMARWRDQGWFSVPVSINISARQLKSDQFRRQLVTSMNLHEIAPAFLAIELTECTMLEDDATILAELDELRNMGLELHIDDFGTGYSSLSQMQRLNIDTIKIDQSFVQAIGVQEKGRKLCEAMIQIGHTLGFRVVAEGVETEAQLRELQRMRCDEIQGYFVSEPVPASLVPDLLSRPNFFSPFFPVVQRVVSR